MELFLERAFAPLTRLLVAAACVLLAACGNGGSSSAAAGSADGGVERYALVASLNGDTLTSYAVEPSSGRMQLVDRYPSIDSAIATVINSSRDDVLVVSATGTLFQLRLSSRGKFSFTYAEPTEGNDLRDLVIHPSGDFIYMPDFTDGTINQWTYDAFDQVTPMTPDDSVAPGYVGAGFSALAVSADGNHVYAADLAQDLVARFSVSADGSLVYVDNVAAGNGPFKLALHPDGDVLYALNRLDGTVSIYTVLADGSLSAVGAAQAMGEASISLEGIALSRDGDFLYVSDNDNDRIWQFSIQADGSLAPLATASVAIDASVVLRDLVMSARAKRLYLLDGNTLDNTGSRVLAFAIDDEGELTAAEPEQIATDQWPSDMAFTTGSRLRAHSELAYVINTGSEDINQFALNDAGTLTEFAVGDEPTTGNFPLAAAVHPTGKYVYVVNNSDDTVRPFRRSSSLASLNELITVSGDISTDLGPVAAVVHPTGNFLYVVCEDNNSVSRFDISTNGQLANRSDHSVPFPDPVAIAMDPGGRYVWVVNDLASGNARVILFTVNPRDGTLDYQSAVPTGNNPKSIAVSRDGKRLYVASAGASEVWIYSVGVGGAPTVQSQASTDSGPVTVLVSPADTNVYTANTVASNVSQYLVDGPGSLLALSPDAVSVGTAPVGLAVDPTGRNVLVTNSSDGSITRLRTDLFGALYEQEEVPVGNNPQAVVIIGYTD